jgi:hypothetical protein
MVDLVKNWKAEDYIEWFVKEQSSAKNQTEKEAADHFAAKVQMDLVRNPVVCAGKDYLMSVALAATLDGVRPQIAIFLIGLTLGIEYSQSKIEQAELEKLHAQSV